MLLRGDDPRIVFTSSAYHGLSQLMGPRPERNYIYPTKKTKKDYDPLLHYGHSKLASLYHAQELAEELKDTSILVNSVNPGLVETNILKENMLEAQGKGNIEFMEALHFLDVEEGAYSIMYAATAKAIREKEISGKYIVPFARIVEPFSIAKDKDLSKEFVGEAKAIVKQWTQKYKRI